MSVPSGWVRPAGGDQRGLTAMELMVVLVVVAILSFAAYPYLSNIREVMMVKGAAEQTAAGIRLARQFAITQGSNHCIEFGSNNYQIREADTSPACNGTVVPGYGWQVLSESGNVVTTATTMIFDPIGNRILPGGAGSTSFTVSDTSATPCVSTIIVTLYGGVRVAGC